jgi:hypothetical protein
VPSVSEPEIVTVEVETTLKSDLSVEQFGRDEYKIPFRKTIGSIVGVEAKDVSILSVSRVTIARRRLTENALQIVYDITAMVTEVLDDDEATIDDLLTSIQTNLDDALASTAPNENFVDILADTASSLGYTAAATAFDLLEAADVTISELEVLAVNTPEPTHGPTKAPDDFPLLEVVIPLSVFGFFTLIGVIYYFTHFHGKHEDVLGGGEVKQAMATGAEAKPSTML